MQEITKEDRVKVIADNRQTIIEFLERNWSNLLEDKAISEKDGDRNADTRRVVKDFFYKTDKGLVSVTFEFRIHTAI